MANTKVINLEPANTTDAPPHYTRDLEDDRIENANVDKIDAFAGHVTASFQTLFYQSGALAPHAVGAAEPYGGMAVAQEDRIITEVSLVMAVTGTGGVTTMDVNVQESAGAAPTTIFITDDVRPHISASTDATNLWDVISAKTFLTSSWAKGRVLTVNVDEAGTGAADAAVIVHWKPSASYGV